MRIFNVVFVYFSPRQIHIQEVKSFATFESAYFYLKRQYELWVAEKNPKYNCMHTNGLMCVLQTDDMIELGEIVETEVE